MDTEFLELHKVMKKYSALNETFENEWRNDNVSGTIEIVDAGIEGANVNNTKPTNSGTPNIETDDFKDLWVKVVAHSDDISKFKFALWVIAILLCVMLGAAVCILKRIFQSERDVIE